MIDRNEPAAARLAACLPAGATIAALRAEVCRARLKHPGRHKLLAALMEEVGELAQAIVEYDGSEGARDLVGVEALQVATVALRIVEEGDASHAVRAIRPTRWLEAGPDPDPAGSYAQPE